MKKYFLIVFLITFFSWGKNSNPDSEIKTDLKFIKTTAEQLDYLHNYNVNQKGFNKDWYVVILGKSKDEISGFLNNLSYDHVSVSSEYYEFTEESVRKINDELIEINKNEKYAAYAFITDNKKEIVIPTVPIDERKIGSFLTKLEGKLITSGFDTPQDIADYKDQRALFKSIEEKIRKSQSRTNSNIKKIIDEIYDQTTTFKSSPKRYKLLSYSILTFLNFKNREEGDTRRHYVKVYGTQHRHAKGDSPNIDRSVIASYIKGSSTDYSSPENRMLARVEAYRKYIEGEELIVDGLKEGIGKRVYVNQKRLANTEEDLGRLLELSNFLTEAYSKQTITEKYEVITNYASIESGKNKKDLLTIISDNNIISKEGFLELYPYHGIARQYDKGLNAFKVYFSENNLWTKTGNLNSNEVLSDDYNANSIDYLVSQKQDNATKYYYSLSDLIARYKCFTAQDGSNESISREILRLEGLGEAHSVAQGEFYDQYLAIFGTDDAYPFIAYCSALWAKDVLAAYMAYRLAFQYGAFLMEEVAKQIGKEAFKQIIKKYGKDALQGAFIDYGIQATFNYVFDNKYKTFNEAARPSNINWISVAAAAAENTIKYKNIYAELGISSSIGCFVGGVSDTGGFKDSFDVKGCAMGVVGVLLGKGVQKGISKLGDIIKPLAKYSRDNLKIGLKKLGIEGKEADEIIDVIKKGTDDVNSGSVLDDLPKDLISDINSNHALKNLFENATNLNKIKFKEAWEILINNPVLRKRPKNLVNISKWLNDAVDKQKLIEGISKSKSKQKLINEIGSAKSKVHVQVLIKDFDNIPGVLKGRYTSNASKLSDKSEIPSHWNPEFDLNIDIIKTFTGKIKPVELKPGDVIYRVTHSNGGGGAYWTRVRPEKLKDVIGGTAVRPQWNNFEFIFEFKVPEGSVIKSWAGKAAKQQVDDVASNYHLPGGDEQLFISYISKQVDNFDIIVKKMKAVWE